MAQNQETNQETLDRIAEELKDLEPQDNLQRFGVKRSVVRVIDRPHLLSIPQLILTGQFYNRLREKLEIPGQVDCFVTRAGDYRSPRDLARVLVENGDATTAGVENFLKSSMN